MTRVLIVSHGHPSFPSGGAERCAYYLHQAFAESASIESHFLGCVTALDRTDAGETCLQSIEGAANEFLLYVGAFDPFLLTHGLESRSLEDFGRLLTRLHPDVVHFHHLFLIGSEALAVVRNRLPEARIVLTLHDYQPICHNGGLMVKTGAGGLCHAPGPDACHGCFPEITQARFALRRQHLKTMMGLVDCFTVPSRFARDRYVEWGLDPETVAYLPNALPASLTPPAETETRKRNRFALFANIAPHKGVRVALDALSRLDAHVDIELTIHGGLLHPSAEFRADFAAALERAGPRVIHRGAYAPSELSDLMMETDWVIVPSTWWENAPLSILEAFRHGRPVITSNIGGMAELVAHDVNGLVFPAGDPRALARLLCALAGDDETWSRLATAAPNVRTTAEIARAHTGLYAELRGEPARKAG